MIIKKLLIAAFSLAISVCLSAQNKTIIITESSLPYYSQSWFYSGAGNDLQTSQIKTYWDEGKRITSVAYTTKGWFVTMAQGTGITQQQYKRSESWPNEWISEEWKNDYYITSISRSNKEWLVVMSKGIDFKDQAWKRGSLSELIPWWYDDKLDNGYYITDMAFNGTDWTLVVSKTSKFYSQGYFFANDDDVLSNIKSKVYDNGYNVHLLEYGDGEFFVVYGNYSKDDSRQQNYIINPSDVNSYISNRWDESHNISYLGGGFSGSASQTPSSKPQQQNTLPAKYLVSHYGMYGQERVGTFHYLDDGGTDGHARIHTLKFEKSDGKYRIRFPAATYNLKEVTSTEFVFENDIRLGPDPYWSYYMAGTMTQELKEKRDEQFRIRVSKDWDRIVMNGKTIMIAEVTKEYFDAALEINKKAYQMAMESAVYIPDQSYHSEVADQLQEAIEESERKLDAMNGKQNDLYKKRDDMNRGHTIIRYKYTNTPSTPSVWCPICNKYDKPHDHVLNDGRH